VAILHVFLHVATLAAHAAAQGAPVALCTPHNVGVQASQATYNNKVASFTYIFPTFNEFTK